ncbi:cohesin domain-containing protein [Candidatus Bathyarchaeota archaeon]|nr:cohesin domain-containing protein [Candidatus Bathyarchaeota archaeon]
MRKLLPTILITMMLITFAMALTPHAKADDGAVVSVLPALVDIAAVDSNQTVDINVTDVIGLFGYEMKIWYLKTIVNVTTGGAARPVGHFLEPIDDPANYFQAKWLYTYNFNDTHGMLWLSVTLLAPETARNGSGILVRITFNGIAVGPTPVVINYPGFAYPAKLSDNTAEAIPCTATDATINVIPEFLIALLLPIFAVTSLIAVSIAKLRKRRQIY